MMTRFFNFALIILISCVFVFAKDDDALILERANRNESVYSSATGEFISHLKGNVVFRYEDMRIRSDEATWQKNRGIVDFRKNVKVTRSGETMTCDRLNFTRENKLLVAVGSVVYRDSAQITTLRGNNAEYRTDTKEATLKGNPLLTRLDTAQTDTLFISGRTMKYNDSLKIATVIENVNLRQGELTATCRKADYFSNTGLAQLRTTPVINYESHRIVGDSIDLVFDEDKLKNAIVMGRAHGNYREVADSTKDTTSTDIRSDSLHLAMFESGKVRSMKAFGSARGSYSESSALSGNSMTTNLSSDSLHIFMFEETGKVRVMRAFGNAHGRTSEFAAKALDSTITHIWSDSLRVRINENGKIAATRADGRVRSLNFALSDSSSRANEVTGRMMTLSFGSTGKAERAIVKGDARSVYYLDEEEGGGANRAGGDQILVTFINGKAQRLRIKGNAKGIYFP